ncbi:hypothetical protein F5X99DRAFT_428885 [Biscogniauxia marginata]|nr:hypothetical protein F5X99DRAFT_428885 [Biscogniauxia marginata]
MDRLRNHESAPPPYSLRNPFGGSSEARPAASTSSAQVIQPWQKRWNKEWVAQGIIPDLRYRMDRCERHPNGWDKAEIKSKREGVEQTIARFDRMVPGHDKGPRKGLRRLLHNMSSHIGDWKVEYDEFRKWRQERKEKVWKIEAVMEDQGEDPKWQAELVFKIRPEHYAELKEDWFDFPSPNNIKWFWVTRPCGLRRMAGRADDHWGPHSEERRMLPFFQEDGRVLQNSPRGYSAPHWQFWSNLPMPDP